MLLSFTSLLGHPLTLLNMELPHIAGHSVHVSRNCSMNTKNGARDRFWGVNWEVRMLLLPWKNVVSGLPTAAKFHDHGFITVEIMGLRNLRLLSRGVNAAWFSERQQFPTYAEGRNFVTSASNLVVLKILAAFRNGILSDHGSLTYLGLRLFTTYNRNHEKSNFRQVFRFVGRNEIWKSI